MHLIEAIAARMNVISAADMTRIITYRTTSANFATGSAYLLPFFGHRTH